MAYKRASLNAALWVLGFAVIVGCVNERPPKMQGGTGAISGKFVGADKDPFDVSLAGSGPSALTVILSSPAHGEIAQSHPRGGKPEFTFDNVTPGEYELSVYASVPGKRSIAGSQTVTVNANQVTPVTMTLQVQSTESAGAE